MLKAQKFHLKKAKCELYTPSCDCLGHLIDDHGIHANMDKMERIQEWRTPQSYNDVQKFLGLIQYLPNVAVYTSLLSMMCRNNDPFLWLPMHESCFQNIKLLAASGKVPVLRPIDPKMVEPIWVICDTSVSGVGVYYGQGPTWKDCYPAGFMSKKFTLAQTKYRVFEQETLAILKALLKWEDKLIGYRFHVITDHEALMFFKTQRHLSNRQTRWMEYLSQFNFDIQYVKGKVNILADVLSRYYESDLLDERHSRQEYITTDSHLDKECDDMSKAHVAELEVEQLAILLKATEIWDEEARTLECFAESGPSMEPLLDGD